MVTNWKSGLMLLMLIGIASSAASHPASAISAELARKCSALMAKQFPPREPANPAAGSAKGSGRAQQDFYNKCVANNGSVDVDDKPAK